MIRKIDAIDEGLSYLTRTCLFDDMLQKTTDADTTVYACLFM
jgi:hypothetical protein